MLIGLIDVDGCHGKKKRGATTYPNLALGKIASPPCRLHVSNTLQASTPNRSDR